jgi:hypothetical protein
MHDPCFTVVPLHDKRSRKKSNKILTVNSVSSRISKGQGYRGFLRKRAGSSFGQKKGQFASYKEKLEKWTEFTTFKVNKMFSHKF